MILKNYLRRAWQWLLGYTWYSFKYWLDSQTNNRMYRRTCRDADKLTQKLNWQRVYLFPKPKEEGPGIQLVTTSQLAEANRHRSKKHKFDVKLLLQHSYGWADRNTSALETFYRGVNNSKRAIRKANKIKKRNEKLRQIPVHESDRIRHSGKKN